LEFLIAIICIISIDRVFSPMNRLNLLLTTACFSVASLYAAPVSSITPSWHQQNRVRLSDGEVVVFSPPKSPSSGAQLAAAIHMDASPEEIWRVITDPEKSTRYLRNVKEAHLLKSAGNTQLVSHTIKPGLLPISISYRFQSFQTPCSQVRFKMVDGDLRDFQGSWQLIDGASLGLSGGTVVFYQLFLDPGDLLPPVLVRKNLSRNVPQMLQSLRERVYSLQRA
jgi:hypothetical protein